MTNFEVGNKEIQTKTRVSIQKIQGLDRQAERTAMPTLASCVPLLLMLLLLLPESLAGFARGKSRFETRRSSVGCIVQSFSGSVRATVLSCVIDVFCPHSSTAQNAHATNASPGGLCTRTLNETFLCWCGCESCNIKRF